MVAVNSMMLPLGTQAPDFALCDPSGKRVSLLDFDDKPVLLVAFISNHCPFVKHILEEFVRLVAEYQPRGVGVAAISSNDVSHYPDDSPENMANAVKLHGFSFPYLYDETQQTAKDYQAACTPDFYVFDKDRRLRYRGRMDDSTPGNHKPVTGKDLRAALDALLSGQPVAEEQLPSIGCNIKWKAGNEPEYFR